MAPVSISRFLACALVSTLACSHIACAQSWGDWKGNHTAGYPALLDATSDELAAGMEAGLFTSVDLVNAYTARILEVNSTLKMVTQLNPDALSIAAALDEERAQGDVRGPLHGMPILIKNNIATADKMDNTAGSYALAGAKVPRDSTMAAKLRQAGAVILGKTNLSQWANFRSDNTSNGWSALGGQTEGAYYPGQDPSGSSSGSGVASSLGLALASLGTETSGSITSPSSNNNIVGIKPTVGLTGRDLVVPISEHQDTVGPMARTVYDAALLLSAIAGPSPYDNYTSAIPFATIPDYTAACKATALKGARLGVPRNVIDIPTNDSYYPLVSTFDSTLAILRSLGAEIIDNTNFTGYEELNSGDSTLQILQADFTTDLPKEYLSQLSYNPNDINNLADLTNYTHANPLEDWPERDTELWETGLALGYGNTSPYFWGNYTRNMYLAGPLGVTGALKNYSLDALILPTDFAYGVPAIIGSPIITVPMSRFPDDTPVTPNGFGNLNATAPNIPIGISFFAERWSEEKLIALGYAFEQATMVRQTIQPYIQPTTELADVVAMR